MKKNVEQHQEIIASGNFQVAAFFVKEEMKSENHKKPSSITLPPPPPSITRSTSKPIQPNESIFSCVDKAQALIYLVPIVIEACAGDSQVPFKPLLILLTSVSYHSCLPVDLLIFDSIFPQTFVSQLRSLFLSLNRVQSKSPLIDMTAFLYHLLWTLFLSPFCGVLAETPV